MCKTSVKGGKMGSPIHRSSDIGSNYINYILPDSKNRTWFATDAKRTILFD